MTVRYDCIAYAVAALGLVGRSPACELNRSIYGVAGLLEDGP